MAQISASDGSPRSVSTGDMCVAHAPVSAEAFAPSAFAAPLAIFGHG